MRAHLPELLFAALLLAVLPMRDLWAPDEPDFAQCVKEMRLRGSWLLPYLNGVPYSEKPILYYWVMKVSAGLLETLTGGLGFTQGVAAWALRLPSVVASVAFLAAFRRWLAAGQPIAAAIETAHQTAGRAMIFSTLALVIGFLALTTSGFIPTVSFGALSCLTLTGGLLGNLVVLPVLLSLLGPWLE